MSKDLNQCSFIGRLGKDPEIKYQAAGGAVASLSIACGDDYKNKKTGEKVEQTNWIRIVAFGRLAEIIGEYTKKGSQIFISGKQVTRKWQNKDGQDQYTTEIVASEMQMLDSRGGSGGSDFGGGQQQGQQQGQGGYQNKPQSSAPQQSAPQQNNSGQGFDDSFDDDIPF